MLKEKRDKKGKMTSSKFKLQTFRDSDTGFLSDWAASGNEVNTAELTEDTAHPTGNAKCCCPPSVTVWPCAQDEYDSIMDGSRCQFYRKKDKF